MVRTSRFPQREPHSQDNRCDTTAATAQSVSSMFLAGFDEQPLSVSVVGVVEEEGCLATSEVCGGRAGGEDMDVHRRLILLLLEHVRRDIRA